MEFIEIGCLAIAASILAADEALKKTHKLKFRFPNWVKFLPVVLLLVAGVLFFFSHNRGQEKSAPMINSGTNNGIMSQGDNNNLVINRAARESNALYQGDTKVGEVTPNPIVDEVSKTITFGAASFESSADLQKNKEYEDFLLEWSAVRFTLNNDGCIGFVSMSAP